MFRPRDLAGGRRTPLASHGRYGLSGAFSPSGSLIAVGGLSDGLIRIGSVSGREPHVLVGHKNLVRALAFSPDERWLASASDDYTIRLWPVPDVTTTPLHLRPHAQLLAVLRSHTNLRATFDSKSPKTYRLEPGPFPGWVKRRCGDLMSGLLPLRSLDPALPEDPGEQILADVALIRVRNAESHVTAERHRLGRCPDRQLTSVHGRQGQSARHAHEDPLLEDLAELFAARFQRPGVGVYTFEPRSTLAETWQEERREGRVRAGLPRIGLGRPRRFRGARAPRRGCRKGTPTPLRPWLPAVPPSAALRHRSSGSTAARSPFSHTAARRSARVV